eukprot:TRINITY_DN35107_c0_g1_i1.p1 TRINITY_DN35107_c0_g1~~TRINITY_DN35107_c0_g1_i1.p1  ORF type:complete len:222 (+),score=76.77 TRINITY_DN35107_c0_g1_i1:30-668(+)
MSNGSGTLYGPTFSTCMQRVLVVSHSLGVEHKISPVDLSKGEHKQPANLARQPFGRVPSFESGDVKLFESRAIARYVDRVNGSKLSGAGDAAAYGRTEVWANVEVSEFNGPASAIVGEAVFKKMFGGGEPDQDKLAKLKAEFATVLDVYEKHLSSSKFLSGDSLTYADLFHLPYGVHAFRVFPDLKDSRPHLKAWFEGLEALPAWKATLAQA